MQSVNKISLIAIIVIAFMSITVGCKEPKQAITYRQLYLMGTVIQIKVLDTPSPSIDLAIEEAATRLQEIEDKMSINKDTSEMAVVSQQAGKDKVKVSEDTFFVLQQAVQYGEETQGSFDPTIAPIVKLWGIGTTHAKLPKQEEIEFLLPVVDYKDIWLNPATLEVKLPKKNQAIDLGAIAKGYAADEVKKIFEKHAIQSAFIDIGGNILTIGTKPDGSKWKMGVQNPLEPREEHVGIVSIQDQTLVTSGNYERYFEEDGVRYHHIFDPRTGYPVDNELMSTTIISDMSMDADALSTSVYVMGLTKGKAFIESIEGVEAIFITKDQKIHMTSGAEKIFIITNKEYVNEKR